MITTNKIIKLSSNQGGPFNNQNLVDFDIHAGVYDLSKSYIQLRARCPSAGADASGVYMPINQFKDDAGTTLAMKFKNACLIKNASMTSANKGTVADVRRTDVLNTLFQNYEMNAMERNSNSKQDLVQSTDFKSTDSIFRETRREGNIASKEVSAPIKIPLSHLFGVGKVDTYSVDKYGKTRIHCELNRSRIVTTQVLGNNAPVSAASNWARSNTDNTFADQTVANGADGKTLLYSKDIPLENSPFWVGQVLRVSAAAGVGSPAAVTNKVVRITSILYRRGAIGANQARIELTLSEAIGPTLTGSQTRTGVVCDGDNATFDFSIDTAELILAQKPEGSPVPELLKYFEFSTEEHNANSVKNLQRQFQIEPESVNVYIANTPDGFSVKKGKVLKWRLRLDNEDLSNRDILVNSPLSRDRVVMCLKNSNKELKSITERGQKSDAGFDTLIQTYDASANDCLMICNPVPTKPQEKLLQVNIDSSDASLSKLCLFKELIKSL